jgi:plastocyanin
MCPAVDATESRLTNGANLTLVPVDQARTEARHGKEFAMKTVALILSMAAAQPLAAASLHGTVTCHGARDNAGAVVYVVAVSGKTFSPPREHAKIDQTNLSFVPHVLPVLVGTTVDFLNSDSVLHNVFSPDAVADKMNLGTWPKGEARSHTFKKVGFVSLLCIVHPEMEGYVAVLPTPFFAVTDASGSYTISDLPDGTYGVKVWHPKLKSVERSVSVPVAGATDFQLSK